MNPYRVVALDSLSSTNDEAMGRLRSGEAGGFVVTARSQTGGRGRRGRVWESPPGNLYASFALVDPAPTALAPQLGFVAGVALCDTLRNRLGGDELLQIKWPNDMVFDGAKLAGMLLESTTLPGGRFGCIIGIGVNCVSSPEGLPYRATHLAEAGDPSPDPQGVLTALGAALAATLASWQRGAGFAAIRKAWLARAAGVGRRVTVSLPSGTSREGALVGLDTAGRLMLETDAGSILIDAGDVFLPGFVAGVMDT